MYKNKREIQRRLKFHLERSGVKDNFFGIFLKGSQNYMKNYNVNSDVDSVVIYIPSKIDIINTSCTKKETIKLECGEEIAFLDIRTFFREIVNPNLFTLEILQTEFFILNESYKKEIIALKSMLQTIIESNKKTLIENICKINERNMRYINKNGLCEKKAFHLIRMSKSAVKINLGKKSKECLKPISDSNVKEIKYDKSVDYLLLMDRCNYFYQNSNNLKDIAENDVDKKQLIKESTNQILFSILYRNISQSIDNQVYDSNKEVLFSSWTNKEHKIRNNGGIIKLKNNTLNFIGRGSAFNVQEGNTSSYVKKENHLLLIDCGSDVFKSLIEKDVLKDVDEIDVLLTHMHPDHFGSLGDLIFYTYFKMGASQLPSLTIHHKSNNLTKTLESLGVYSFMYFEQEFYTEFKGKHRRIKDYFVKPVRVKHYPSLADDNQFETIGFDLIINNKSIYYSGDSYIIPKKILTSFLNLEFDEFYQDTCALDYEGNPHLSYKKLLELIPKELRGLVSIMHIDETFNITQAEKDGFKVVEKI